MLECNNCIYKRNIPGNTHISCARAGIQYFGVNEHGVKNGWFSPPFNFDPVWADSCSGFTPTYLKDIKLLSRENLMLLYILERTNFMEKGNLTLRDTNLIEGIRDLIKKSDKSLNDIEEEDIEKIQEMLIDFQFEITTK